MKNMKLLRAFLKTLFCVSVVLCSTSNAGAVTWIDWQSTSNGSLTIGSTNIGVSMTGNPMALVNGDGYYNNGSTGGTSPSGTYGGLTPSDLIQVNGTGTFNLTFDSPIVDPYIALVSVGQGGWPVTYSFDDPFSVISSGGNYWGYSGYSVSPDGTDFTGSEYNGILKFSGTYSSISFDIAPSEHWHGFNFGVADSASSVPEPATLLLFGVGLVGVGIARRLRRQA